MEFGWNEILIGTGGILMTWIFNNTKLREGVTTFVLNKINSGYNITTHNVKTCLKSLKFEAKLTDFDNPVKTELYQYFVGEFFIIMDDIINNLLTKKKMSFQETKTFIKINLYDDLLKLNEKMDNDIFLPPKLNVEFSKFRNYMIFQFSYAIEHALNAQNKKILLIQILDAIENNSRWILFYCTEMFNNFNGGFDKLTSEDIFINKDV